MKRAAAGASSVARKGFTVLEAAVALTIIGLVTIGAFGAYGAQLRADARAEEIVPAAALARDRLAAVDLSRELGLGQLPDSIARGRFAPPFDLYEWEIDSRAAGVGSEPGLYDVRVTIRWTSGEYTLVTRRYRDPARTERLAGVLMR